GYLEHVADRFGLRRFLPLHTTVTRAEWDEGSCQWTVSTADGRARLFDVVVSALGAFRPIPHPRHARA
ncbi:MAG TPA: NAD(P)/FAD-dependent oxidoreductase, partial [Mycobacterium sp.]|nr:NAD(P)/FAD-dependent oxidoreductase [Mycobacterium sp.]